MKWLHISDIHFNPSGDGTSTSSMKERMRKYFIENHIKVDELFITGDFRYAAIPADCEETAQNTAQFIKEMAALVGISDTEHIHLVPGNHDLDRSFKTRKHLVNGVKKDYLLNDGLVSSAELHDSLDAFYFYNTLLKNIYGEVVFREMLNQMYKNPHLFKCCSDYNIVYMNTALFSCFGGEEGTLVIGSKFLLDTIAAVNAQNGNVPTIVLAHHALRMLAPQERKSLLKVFRDYNVCLYLCGHEHDLWFEPITDVAYQINMGCIKYEHGAQAGFAIGETQLERNAISIKCYLWDNNFSKWGLYSQFGQQDGMLKIRLLPTYGVEEFNTLNAMFVDVENYIAANPECIGRKKVFGYGLDMQVVLQWLEKIMLSFAKNIDFKLLALDPNCAFITEERTVESNYDAPTLISALERLKILQPIINKNHNSLEVKLSSIPYPFHGLMIDNILYITWLTLTETGRIESRPPYLKMHIGHSKAIDNMANSFTSLFEFYWKNGISAHSEGQ